MKLETYLTKTGIKPADFAKRIGVAPASVYRYLAGDRIPARGILRAISRETGGKVTADDFFSEPMKEAG